MGLDVKTHSIVADCGGGGCPAGGGLQCPAGVGYPARRWEGGDDV